MNDRFWWFIRLWFCKWTIFQYFAWNIFRRQVTYKHLAGIIFRGYKASNTWKVLIHVLSQALVYWLTIFACHTALFYNSVKKKIREKLHTLLHYCLLFAIYIYFSDFFLAFSRGLNSTDNNLRDVSCGFNFTNGKFLWYFVQITFCRKFQNLRNLQNRIHAKINPFKLY